MTRQTKLFLKILSVVMILFAAWAAYDLFSPRSAQLRNFDPDEVARLETAMWRSYYEHHRFRLFTELAELLRTQYHMSIVRSQLVAYYAAHAAIVFQRGQQRSDYEKALPDLVKYYESVRRMSDQPFDVNQVAKLELEWWIIHRQRAQHQPGDLDRALAELQSAIYNLPVDRFMEHGRLRAEAMAIRDTKAEQGGVSEADWQRIYALLHESWRSLHQAVNR